MMEEDGADIIQVSIQSEETSPGLMRPDLDLVVISAGDEQRLSLMKVYTSDRSIMLFEAVNEGPHAIVP